MIKCYVENHRSDDALHLFDQMIEKSGCVPDDFTLPIVLKGDFGAARKVFDKMVEKDLVSWNALMDGMPGRNLASWNAMLNGCMKSGDFKAARRLFDKMDRRDVITWNSMTGGLESNGKHMEALVLFNKMLMAGFTPNQVTLVSILSAISGLAALSKGRLGQKWRRYFDMMLKVYEIEPTVEHYGCLVDILCRAGHLEEAKEMIEKMPMTPNNVIWMSSLSGSKYHKNVEIGEYAAQRVIEVAPGTTGCYVFLSNIYAAAGQWDKVSKIREMMRKRGVKKDPGCSAIEHKEEQKDKEAEPESHSEKLAIAFSLINVGSGIQIRIVKNLRV
ncbi:hypothetical protein AgCh_007180 [Apium graveolens]